MSILHTEQEKITCVDQQIEMAVVANAFQVFRMANPYGGASFSILVEIRSHKGEDSYSINTKSPDLVKAVNEAYIRYRRLVSSMEGVA